MRDESHLDDMRAAIRGDFERLARRRGSQELMHEAPPRAEEPAEVAALAEPPSEPVRAPDAAGEAPEPEAALASDAEPEPDAEPPRRGFLARLFGRSL